MMGWCNGGEGFLRAMNILFHKPLPPPSRGHMTPQDSLNRETEKLIEALFKGYNYVIGKEFKGVPKLFMNGKFVELSLPNHPLQEEKG